MIKGKTIIAGSRSITSYSIVEKAIALSHFHITEVVSGHQPGVYIKGVWYPTVDLLGVQWAIKNNIRVKLFPADWNTHGKPAGHIRNEEMGKYADQLIAVWDGVSNGTAGMIKIMGKKNKPTYVYNTATSSGIWFNKKD